MLNLHSSMFIDGWVWMGILNIIATLSWAFVGISQLIKTIKSKDVENLSFGYLLFFFISCFLTFGYTITNMCLQNWTWTTICSLIFNGMGSSLILILLKIKSIKNKKNTKVQ